MLLNCTLHDIAELARELAECSGAASKITALNRAYYASYHALAPLAELVPGAADRGPQGGLPHREIPRRLRDWRFLPVSLTRLKSFAPEAKVVAGELAAAMAAREEADYGLGDGMEADTVTMQLKRMEIVLDFAQRVRAEIERLGKQGAA